MQIRSKFWNSGRRYQFLPSATSPSFILGTGLFVGGGLGVIIFRLHSLYPLIHLYIFQHFWFTLFRVSSYSSAIYILPVVLLTTAWNVTRYVSIMQILSLFDPEWRGGAKNAPQFFAHPQIGHNTFFWHQHHGFCFLQTSTLWLLFCSNVNNMAVKTDNSW